MKRRAWRLVKWGSLAASLGSIIAAVILMWTAGPKEPVSTAENVEKPQTKVESPVIVERQEGEVIWQLRAAEASQQLDGRMQLSMPKLLLFTADKKEIPIESRQAWFDPLERNIHFKQQVNVHYGTWNLTCEEMIYENSKDEIYIPGTFKITGETVNAHGKQLRLNRQSEILTVDNGIWIEDSHPRWQGVLP